MSLKLQLEQAESYEKRAAKRAEKARSSLHENELQLDMLLQNIESQKAEVSLLDEQCVAARAAVATLAARMAQELSVVPSTLAKGEREQGPPAGYVSIAFAEEKWAEREAAVAQQIAHLQALVANQAVAKRRCIAAVLRKMAWRRESS